MELPQGQVLLAIAAAVVVLLVFPRGRALLRLVGLFGIAFAMTLGVEWLILVGIRTLYPQVTGTGFFEGLASWGMVPALVVAALVTVIAWREGV